MARDTQHVTHGSHIRRGVGIENQNDHPHPPCRAPCMKYVEGSIPWDPLVPSRGSAAPGSPGAPCRPAPGSVNINNDDIDLSIYLSLSLSLYLCIYIYIHINTNKENLPGGPVAPCRPAPGSRQQKKQNITHNNNNNNNNSNHTIIINNTRNKRNIY